MRKLNLGVFGGVCVLVWDTRSRSNSRIKEQWSAPLMIGLVVYAIAWIMSRSSGEQSA